MNIARAVAVALTAVSVVGCGSVQNINDTMKRGDTAAGTASDLLAGMQAQRQGQQRETVVFTDRPIVAFKPLPIVKVKGRGEPLNCPITFAPQVPVDILEFAQTVTKLCGIPVRVTPDALSVINSQRSSSNDAPSALNTTGSGNLLPAVGQALPSLPAMPNAINSTTPVSRLLSGGSGSSAGLISNIKWDGKPLEGLLNVVTSRFGVSWKRVDGVISIFYLDTRAFNIYAIPSTIDMTSVVQSGTTSAAGVSGETGSSGGIAGNSGSTQTTSVSNKSSITDDIAKNISAMLTPGVGRMTQPSKEGGLSSSTGTILVTDTPEVLDRIDSYLNGENKNITRQVLLNVKVLSVTLTDKDSLGIDWGLVYKSLSGKYGINLKNAFQADPSSVSGSVSILDTATGGAAAYAGSNLLINALSQQGRVSTVTSPSVTTLNLQPVPVQVARQTSYLASVQTTNTAQVGSTTSLTPGTVTTGFNMNLLPYVMQDNNLLLQYSINLSALQRIRQVTSGGSTIEIPEVDNRIFSQKVRLKSGETLVLSGFEQSIDTGNKQGVGNPNNIVLGGGLGSDNRRDVVVVLITPIVMD